MKRRGKNRRERHARRPRLLGLETASSEARARRTAILIQIDGLSYRNLNEALLRGNMNFLRKRLAKKELLVGPWRSMLPSSTGAFQCALFYGDNENVPGFFWFDKRSGQPVSLNTVQGSSELEERVRARVAPFPGLLHEGSAYSSLITGGAKNSLLTFAQLFRPSLNVSTTWTSLLLFLPFQIVLLARLLFYAVVELLVALYDLATALFTEKNKYLEFKFLFARIASVVLCREISTLAAIMDIYRGAGPIYLNHVAYDEHAHHRGPTSKFAFWAMKGIDGSLARIWKAVERAKRLGIREYDVYVWSDHGQTETVPFQELFYQDPVRHFQLLFDSLCAPTEEERANAESRKKSERLRNRRILRGPSVSYAPSRLKAQAEAARTIGDMFPGFIARIYNRMLKPAHDASAREFETAANDGNRTLGFVSTGTVAHLYLLERDTPVAFEEWNRRCPAFLVAMATHTGVGFALTRSGKDGAFIGINGHWFDLNDDNALANAAPPLLLSLLRDCRDELIRWANMPSAGDMLLFGDRGANQPSVSYAYEHGGHAGPSLPEMTPFLIIPAERVDDWKGLIDSHSPRLTVYDLHNTLRGLYCTEQKDSTHRNAS